MKKTERIIWISVVSMFLFLTLFTIFIKEARARSFNYEDNYLEKLVQVFKVVKRDYVDENIDDEKLVNGAIKGMLEALDDPHSVYLSEKDMENMMTTSKGNYGGVGMLISEQDKKIIVISPFEGSPAYKKGIKAGDFILSVDDVSLEGKTVEEAANMLRGNPGTVVKVEILSDGAKYSVELKRAVIDLPYVKHDIIDDKYGYLRIIQFSGTTDNHVKEALEEFKQKNVKGIIVDLRQNPGGLLAQVITVVDYFQDKGVIVSTKGRNPFDTKIIKASKLKTIVDKDIPVIVIVDKGSASASEIFAGAIKDTQRGILIGEKTFGKGSVQTFYRLGNDGFKLTIAKYYTPSNKVIDGVGIEPDIEIKEPELTEQEKNALVKLYEDKVIDKFASKNSNPTDKEIDNFIDLLLKDGYNLSRRYLKKLIRNAVELNDENKKNYDLEFDIQLQKALEILNNGLIKRDNGIFYLKGRKPQKLNLSKKELNSDNIYTLSFKLDSIDFLKSEQNYLDNIIKILLKTPNENILVIGHASKTGSKTEQMRLSLKRAEIIADYLIKNGISSDRITYMGKGATEPIDINNNEKNNRVEIIITDN